MELHELIVRERTAKGWLQRDLARALNVTPAAVSRWESGERFPSVDNLRALARLFAWDQPTVADLALRITGGAA